MKIADNYDEMKAKRTELFNELKREASQSDHNNIVEKNEIREGQLVDINLLENIEEEKICNQSINYIL